MAVSGSIGSAEEAEKVVGQWRVRVQQAAPEVKHETVTYEKHRIDVASHDAVTVATVYDGELGSFAGESPAGTKNIARSRGWDA